MEGQRYSNYELNSFLTILTERWDEDATQAVVSSFCHLSPASNKKSGMSYKNNNAPMSGYTDELGDVTIHDKDVKTFTTGEKPEQIARCGYFKVERRDRKKENFAFIEWHHFWKSDITTRNPEDPPPTKYGIEYDKETLQPHALIRWDYVEEDPPLLVKIKVLVKRTLFTLLFGNQSEYWFHLYVGKPQVIYGESRIF